MNSDLSDWTETSAEQETAGPEVHVMARALMDEHGLQNWTLRFDRAVRRAGQCSRSTLTISLSAPLMALWTEAQIRDTILHEIAHALTSGGHGREWQLKCIQIGADPTRTWGHNGEQEIQGKYTGRCARGHTITRQRISRKPVSCAQCSPYYNERYPITWTQNS